MALSLSTEGTTDTDAPPPSGWRDAFTVFDFAYQPVVSLHTGACYGFEALLRGHAEAGFPSIQAVFDAAYADGSLAEVDRALRARAIRAFAARPGARGQKLFFNLDNRVLEFADDDPGFESRLLSDLGLRPETLCLEISERHPCRAGAALRPSFARFAAHKLVLDDFGAGYAGLQALYQVEPDALKIDRFFVAGIDRDARKKLFAAHVVNLAHTLGVLVVGEGVETEGEFAACREIGCDFAQGFFIQPPITALDALPDCYETVAGLARTDRRRRRTDRDLIRNHLDAIPPIRYDESVDAVLRLFRGRQGAAIVPVVNGSGEPIGVIRDADLKPYVYSPYGLAILRHKIIDRSLADITHPCPTADIDDHAEKALEMFSLEPSSEGLVITEAGRYLGFLAARSLLKVLNEKNLAEAKDMNPLTRLPGNHPITEYLFEALADPGGNYLLVVFDLDHFKPFNDAYGFRRGDRALLLFADVLRARFSGDGRFVGHIGGDDFFVGMPLEGPDFRERLAWVRRSQEEFADGAVALYDEEHRAAQGIEAPDRDGRPRRFPFLTASAACLIVPAGERRYSVDEIVARLAEAKARAKAAPDHFELATMTGQRPPPE